MLHVVNTGYYTMWINIYTRKFGSVGIVSYIGGMSMVHIYDNDTVQDIAHKIWSMFDIGASCKVHGFVTFEDKLIPKGELVVKELEQMYEDKFIKISSDGKKLRKYAFKANSIGGPIAHKIFTWEKRIVDKEPRFTIWRYQ